VQKDTAKFSESSAGQLLKKLLKKNKKRIVILTKVIVLLHDNARPQTVNQTHDLLDSFRPPTPPNSPDLAASDYHQFFHLKQHWQPI